MKNLFIRIGIPILVFSLFVFSCQKKEVLAPEESPQMDKMELLQTMTNLKSAAIVDIEYTLLCEGDYIETDVAKNSISYPDMWDYYMFYGTEGDVVSINVVRIDCEMDPSFTLYFGTSATTEGLNAFYGTNNTNEDLEFLTFRDDEIYPIEHCIGECFAFGDPGPEVTLPYTGWYTLAVHDFGSCLGSSDPLNYSLNITGAGICDADGDGCHDAEDVIEDSNMEPFVTIDGCEYGVENKMTSAEPCGVMMADVLDQLEAGEYKNHGAFVKEVAKLTEIWRMEGLITLEEKDAIMDCAGESSIGHK